MYLIKNISLYTECIRCLIRIGCNYFSTRDTTWKLVYKSNYCSGLLMWLWISHMLSVYMFFLVKSIIFGIYQNINNFSFSIIIFWKKYFLVSNVNWLPVSTMLGNTYTFFKTLLLWISVHNLHKRKYSRHSILSKLLSNRIHSILTRGWNVCD